MTKAICRQSLRTPHHPAGFNKSLYAGTYVCGKIARCTKIFYRRNLYIIVGMRFKYSVHHVFYLALLVAADLAYITSLRISLSNPSLFSTDNLKLDWIPSKIKWKIHISSFKDAYIKSYKMQLPVPLFLVVLHQQTWILQLFRTSFNTIWRKNFITNFPFLTDSPKFPHPLNDQNFLNMMKVFCWGYFIL